MSFADPQTVTISGVTSPLPRISVSANASDYQSADGLIHLLASSQYGRRTRRTIRMDVNKITADPFKPTENIKVGMSVYTVFDMPPLGGGFTSAEGLAAWVGYRTQLAATSDVLISKLLGGEN